MYLATAYWRGEYRGICLIPITENFYKIFKKDYSILNRDDVISVSIIANDIIFLPENENPFFKNEDLWDKILYEEDFQIVSSSDVKIVEEWSSSPSIEIRSVKGDKVEFFVSDPWELGTVDSNYINMNLKELKEQVETKKMGLL